MSLRLALTILYFLVMNSKTCQTRTQFWLQLYVFTEELGFCKKCSFLISISQLLWPIFYKAAYFLQSRPTFYGGNIYYCWAGLFYTDQVISVDISASIMWYHTFTTCIWVSLTSHRTLHNTLTFFNGCTIDTIACLENKTVKATATSYFRVCTGTNTS